MKGRAHCSACELPLAACLCAWVRPVDNRVELIVLQHSHEVHQAKGTVRLLRHCLNRCQVLVGEQFDEPSLQALSQANTALLYPMDETALAGACLTGAAVERLIVLDATWRKSRKMLHLNPWLQNLPRLALTGLPPSGYAALRRAQLEGQRSSLEASVLALQQLEGEVDKYLPLWEAFAGFVEQRLSFVPSNSDR